MKGLDMDSDKILKVDGGKKADDAAKTGKKNKTTARLRRVSTSSQSDSDDSKVSFTTQDLRDMSETYLTFKKLLIDDDGVTIAQSLSSISKSLKEIVKKM